MKVIRDDDGVALLGYDQVNDLIKSLADLPLSIRALFQQIRRPVFFDPATSTLRVGTHAVTQSGSWVISSMTGTSVMENQDPALNRVKWANIRGRIV